MPHVFPAAKKVEQQPNIEMRVGYPIVPAILPEGPRVKAMSGEQDTPSEPVVRPGTASRAPLWFLGSGYIYIYIYVYL